MFLHNTIMLEGMSVVCINLDHREDRRTHVETQLKSIGIENAERFKAIKLDNGALGCSMSHLKCLENAKKNNDKYLMVCEDDIEFTDPELFKKQLNLFLNSTIEWDVILMAGNNMLPYVPENNYCIKVLNCQTTTGYIVKNAYYETLINNYKEGIKLLITEKTNTNYNIDKYWFRLQRKDNWFLIIPLSVVQKEDYSDIEKKITSFKKYMLNYNKCYK